MSLECGPRSLQHCVKWWLDAREEMELPCGLEHEHAKAILDNAAPRSSRSEERCDQRLVDRINDHVMASQEIGIEGNFASVNHPDRGGIHDDVGIGDVGRRAHPTYRTSQCRSDGRPFLASVDHRYFGSARPTKRLRNRSTSAACPEHDEPPTNEFYIGVPEGIDQAVTVGVVTSQTAVGQRHNRVARLQ